MRPELIWGGAAPGGAPPRAGGGGGGGVGWGDMGCGCDGVFLIC